jgi:hypothetical protein
LYSMDIVRYFSYSKPFISMGIRGEHERLL